MESFAFIQKQLATNGIMTSKKTTKFYPFNVRNLTVFILNCFNSTLIAASLNKANTFDECTDILYRSVSVGACNIIYAIIVWKTSKLTEFVDRLTNTVNESE